MIFQKVILKDVGLFSGTQSIDLTVQNKTKPIILFGGKNGAGKTTFFDSIRICLYGKNAFESLISQKEYRELLSEMINHSSREKNSFVEVWIEHKSVNTSDIYKVKRSWGYQDLKTFYEKLNVTKNDAPLTDLESDQWQDFINELIPIGVSQLFFFDGEKIQNLAKNEEGNIELKESFFKMLNLDLIEKLQTDLEVYESKLLKESIGVTQTNLLNELQSIIQKSEQQIDQDKQTQAHKKAEFDKFNYDITRQEQKISEEGGIFAEKRSMKKDELVKVESAITNIETRLRELATSTLPFAFCQKTVKQLQKSIELENTIHRKNLAKKTIENEFANIDSDKLSKEFYNKYNLDKKKLDSLFKELMNKLFNKDEMNVLLQHDLSEKDYSNIVQWKENSEKDLKNLNSYTAELERLTKTRSTLIELLAKAPTDDVLAPLLKSLNELSTKKGMLEQGIKTLDESIKSSEYQLTLQKRKFETELDRLESLTKGSRKLEYIQSSKKVLREYLAELKKVKAFEFSVLATDLFGKLLNKQDLFTEVRVNPDDFSVRFYKSTGEPLLKHKLSAGEKQLFSIAVLWALSKLSGKELPFIIDTPLARLDMTHRDNLIDRFFPKAGSQIIILSTDSEIDKGYLEKLKPSIAKSYQFNYANGVTKVKEGYFW
jgi:DNA sulfur modification protein DndD